MTQQDIQARQAWSVAEPDNIQVAASTTDDAQTRRARLMTWLLFALLVVGLLGVNTHHFASRAYRQDEAWTVHVSVLYSLPEVVRWMVGSVHPPAWQLFVTSWLDFVGSHTEPIMRFSSVLTSAVALALLFRLATDLFDRRVGLLAVILLGTLPVYQFHGHEFRPYALLVAGVAAVLLTWLRWLRRPTFAHALLFMGASLVVFYTHFYGMFVFPALALTTLILLRWNRGRYLRAAGLFALVALASLGWVLPVIQSVTVVYPGGQRGRASADDLEAVSSVYADMQLSVPILGVLLFWTAVLLRQRMAQTLSIFRFGRWWRKLYPLVFLLALLGVVALVNLKAETITPRNLMIILPPLVLLLALGLRALPTSAQIVVTILLLIPAIQTPPNFARYGPYPDLVAELSQRELKGSQFVIDTWLRSQNITVNYYLRERLPMLIDSTSIFHLARPQSPAALGQWAEIPTNLVMDDSAADQAAFAAWLEDADWLYYIAMKNGRSLGADYSDTFRAQIAEAFLWVDSMTFNIPPPERPIQLDVYRRIPADLTTIAQVGDDVQLRGWTLLNPVVQPPCAALTLESWWQVDSPLPDNMSMTFVLADSGGIGVARTDGTPAGIETLLWQPEQPYFDNRTLVIPCDTASGEYSLLVGWYDPGGESLGDLVYLTTITVE